jgi:hypothetical protein
MIKNIHTFLDIVQYVCCEFSSHISLFQNVSKNIIYTATVFSGGHDLHEQDLCSEDVKDLL